MIKRGGENISPLEVEDVLKTHPAVQEAAVVGLPDPLRDECVVAFVAFRKGSGAADPSRLSRFPSSLSCATTFRGLRSARFRDMF